VKDTALVAKLPVEQRVGSGETVDFFVARDKLRWFDAESEERVRG